MKMSVTLLFFALTLVGCGNENNSDNGVTENTEKKEEHKHEHGANAEGTKEHGSHHGETLVASEDKVFHVELSWHEEKLAEHIAQVQKTRFWKRIYFSSKTTRNAESNLVKFLHISFR